MRSAPLFLSLFVVGVLACSSSSAPAGNPGTDTGTPATDSGTPTEDAPFTSDAPSSPPIGSASIGPIAVGAGEDKTVCIYKRMDNTEDVLATRLIADLAPGSHHMIVYRSSVADENLTPFPCNPFEGLVSGVETPLMLVNARHVDFSFPEGVGIKVVKNQMVRIEAHYVNASKAEIEGSGTMSIQGKPLATAGDYQLADFSFWGTRSFNVAPKSAGSTGMKFQKGQAGTKAFALTTHQHQYGTKVDVYSSTAAGDVSTPLLSEDNWSAPKLIPIDVDFTGTNGMSYQCDWENPTDKALKFGESGLTDEMCFVLLYYYPSKGFEFCMDGLCQHR